LKTVRDALAGVAPPRRALARDLVSGLSHFATKNHIFAKLEGRPALIVAAAFSGPIPSFTLVREGTTMDWSKERILIYAPHPDDEAIGCGGLISKAKQAGAEVFVQFVTVGDTADSSPTGVSTAAARLTEIEAVAAHFEWNGWHIAFPGNERHLKLDLVSRFELASAFERGSPVSIAAIEPTIVIGPERGSYNQDHSATAEALHTALRPSDRKSRHHPRAVLAYEQAADQWRLGTAAPPPFLVELEERHVEAKLAAMDLYASQSRTHPHTRSDVTLRALAALRGAQGGAAFAEGFHILRWLA
jgi:N-acetylglucosamine malate deacetylase 1